MEKRCHRTKNLILETKSSKEFFSWYSDRIYSTLKKIDATQIERAIHVVEQAIKNRCQIFVAGNGGSAAISDHLGCDWVKTTDVPRHPPVKTRTLVSNVALLTALANDIDYKSVFSWQLERFAEAGDVLVLLSSSGNSPNIIEAAKAAQDIGVHSIAITGFTGGKVAELVDIHIHIPYENYGIVEDCQQMLMHAITQYLAQTREEPIQAIA